jgi:hypothetical protein
MTVTQFLVGINPKTSSLCFYLFNPYGSSRHVYSIVVLLEFFSMLEPMIFNSIHPKSNKIQTIVIQFIPDLNEQNIYDKSELFLDMD